jgi:hypothetical protein
LRFNSIASLLGIVLNLLQNSYWAVKLVRVAVLGHQPPCIRGHINSPSHGL